MSKPAGRPALILTMLLAAILVGGRSSRAVEQVMQDVLVLPSVGTGGRVAVHRDAVEAALVEGAWRTPAAGDMVARPDGAPAVWETAAAGEDGWLRHDALGGGYAVWRVESPDPAVMMLDASGHSIVYVNGAPRTGDPYGNGWVRLPVALRAGTNELLFHCRRGQLRARLRSPSGSAFFLLTEPTLPDLVEHEDWAVPAGIVVVNATAEPRTDLRIRAGGRALPLRETPVPVIAPMTVRKVPFFVGGALPPGTRSCAVQLELLETRTGVTHVLDEAKVDLRVRRADERRRVTFMSGIDGSVQYYGITPRADGGEATGAPGLILTLHGASVEGMRQASVYQPKDWADVVAPTNRRPFGFDWEDWGRLDAMEVLDLTSARLGADVDRIFLTGHSMGGHGTWHVGVTHADRFAAIGPSAGWVSFWSYGGADRYENATPIERMLLQASSPSDTLALWRNLLPLGVYVLHGDADDNVPVREARLIRDRIAGEHRDFAYHEQPGAGHWWGDRCCDWPPMMEFFAERRRVPDDEVDHVEFHTASPGVSAWSRWVGIEQQTEPLRPSSVIADRDRAARRFTILTGNVARLALRLSPLAPDRPVEIEIDGRTLASVPWPARDGVLRLRRGGGQEEDARAPWRVEADPAPPDEKGPHRAGPFKDVFRHEVLFVYGTAGTEAERTWAFCKARLDAETLWYRGNGSIDVIPDTAFDASSERDRSVVLYGNADTNLAWTALLGGGPVQVRRHAVTVGTRTVTGADLACLFIRPRPGSDVASVAAVSGTGLPGQRLTERLPIFVSGVGYPDLLLLRTEVLRRGTAGIVAAGFFGPDWSLESGRLAWSSAEAAGAP